MQDEHDSRSRWNSEAGFFDDEAQNSLAKIRPVLPEALRRYGVLRRSLWSKEYRFRLLGDLSGLRVLDVGCGDGANSVLLATLGAVVTGLDISPAAIRVAEYRAQINGVEERTRFICSPLELVDLENESFDKMHAPWLADVPALV